MLEPVVFDSIVDPVEIVEEDEVSDVAYEISVTEKIRSELV